jgi:hypothetical protein
MYWRNLILDILYMSHIQALLFNRDVFSVRQANNFLIRNNIEKLKPFHITNKYIRARLLTPNYKKYQYRKGTIAHGIDCIYEFHK